MKRFIVQYNILVYVLLFVGFSSMGQPFEKSRKFSKTYAIGKTTEIQISNKYGDIQLIPWEKDSVRFDVDFKVIATKESKLSSTFDYIDFDFNISKNFVIVETTFAGKGTFWSDVKDLANTVFAGGTKTQIDYKVYLPANTSVKIDNKYGNILISNHQGSLNISLSNGDLKSNLLSGKTDIKLQFANANIKYINEGNIDMTYYSDLQLEDANKLKINSRSSRISIDRSYSLEIDSYRDKYYLDEVSIIEAKNSFTYLEIKNLLNHINLKSNYGEMLVKNIHENTEYIHIESESTDISLYRDMKQSFNLEMTYNEKAGIYFTDELNGKQTIKVDEEKRLAKTSGVLGNISSKPININASILSGDLRIINK